MKVHAEAVLPNATAEGVEVLRRNYLAKHGVELTKEQAALHILTVSPLGRRARTDWLDDEVVAMLPEADRRRVERARAKRARRKERNLNNRVALACDLCMRAVDRIRVVEGVGELCPPCAVLEHL